jgi:hypothetical protein
MGLTYVNIRFLGHLCLGFSLGSTLLPHTCGAEERIPTNVSAGSVATNTAAPATKTESHDEEFRIRTYTELLARAEVILVGEIGDAGAEGVSVKVREWLKGPPQDIEKKWTEPFQIKRASDLLEQESKAIQDRKNGKAPVKNQPAAPAPKYNLPLSVLVENPKTAPQKGATVLLFLWDRLDGTVNQPLRYQLNHPQNVYEEELAQQVKVELGRERTARRKEYLREWDRKMALRISQRSLDTEIRALEAGKPAQGLQLKLTRAVRSLRNDNSLQTTVKFSNLRTSDQSIYDGPLTGFGARIRRKGDAPDRAVILWAQQRRITDGMDPAVLGILDANDFARIAKEGELSREVVFDANDHPELTGLDGECIVNIFYTNDKAMKDMDELLGQTWKGLAISDDVTVVFKSQSAVPVESKAPVAPPPAK